MAGLTGGRASKNDAMRLPSQAVGDGTPEAASTQEPSLHATSNKRRQRTRSRSPAVLKDVSSASNDDDSPDMLVERR